MVRKYRSRWEIILEILRSCTGEGAKKTHIMYRSNLNRESFNKYFQVLVGEGLVAESDDPDGGILYRTTEKGSSLLRVLAKAEGSIPKRK
jgi:predicted transcriptional regulator